MLRWRLRSLAVVVVVVVAFVAVAVHARRVHEQKQQLVSGVRDPPVFPEHFAFDMASLSMAAYCADSTLQTWSCGGPCAYTKFKYIGSVSDSGTDTYGFVGLLDDIIVLSFRGSQSLTNWVYNLRFSKQEAYPNVPGAKVHNGFFQCYEAVSDQVHKQLQNAVTECPKCETAVITGHSLGGAIAVLAAIDQTLPLHVKPMLFTYGCPRVGNQVFAEFVDSKVQHWRVTHDRDVVPHLPPRALSFYHTAREVWEHNDAYQVCDDSGEDKSCSDSVVATSIADHLMYMGLQNNCSQRALVPIDPALPLSDLPLDGDVGAELDEDDTAPMASMVPARVHNN